MFQMIDYNEDFPLLIHLTDSEEDCHECFQERFPRVFPRKILIYKLLFDTMVSKRNYNTKMKINIKRI